MLNHSKPNSKIKEEKESPEVTKSFQPSKAITIYPETVIRILIYIILFLSVVEFALLTLKYAFNRNSGLFNMIEGFFDFNKEANFPTLFSTILLLLASGILFFIYKIVTVKKVYWLFLSALFLFLCFDEAVQIHEKFNKLKDWIGIPGGTSLAHTWVLPYLALVIVLIISLKGFILTLPSKTRNLFILSGAIFVSGALGLEIIEGQLRILSGGQETLTLDILYYLEEVSEMSGVILFIWALLKYIIPNGCSIAVNNISAKLAST